MFSLQAKLRDVVRATKNWCLEFKKHMGLNWSMFEKELLAVQAQISDTQGALLAMERRDVIATQAWDRGCIGSSGLNADGTS